METFLHKGANNRWRMLWLKPRCARCADALEAWNKEILRRLAEIDAGIAKFIDRDEFRRRMQARIGG